MMNLLALFSTDRKLLENRGSFIIRQLCLNLHTERIYRTFAEILEKEDVSSSIDHNVECTEHRNNDRILISQESWCRN